MELKYTARVSIELAIYLSVHGQVNDISRYKVYNPPWSIIDLTAEESSIVGDY